MNSTYMLGNSKHAELRLELLNELTSKVFIEQIGKFRNKNFKILNLGCGSCHLEAHLSQIFSHCHFICMDISADRIKEAKVRMEGIKSSNTFEFIKGDLTTYPIHNLRPCDIIISRFVLSHLQDGVEQLERFLPLVKKDGYVCVEELACDGDELYCNKKNEGYGAFMKIVKLQTQLQNSSFDTGFKLFSKLVKSHHIIHCSLNQAILNTARTKSILRLGVEEAKSKLSNFFKEKRIDDVIASLLQFEEDDESFGLYSRSLIIFAKIK